MLSKLQMRIETEAPSGNSSSMAMILYDPVKASTGPELPVPTGIDFELRNGLIYHVKDNLAHDQNFHAGQHRAY